MLGCDAVTTKSPLTPRELWSWMPCRMVSDMDNGFGHLFLVFSQSLEAGNQRRGLTLGVVAVRG